VPRIGSLPHRLNATWKCALIGGLTSIPLTVGLYWLSGTGNEMSQNMVFVGGLLAGYLAKTRIPDAHPAEAGTRAGLVGALPGLWFIGDRFIAVSGVGGPLWFRIVGPTVMGGLFVIFLLVITALAGYLGAKVGVWLANKHVGHRFPFVGD
jgi:hypothetical protein